MVSEIEEKVSMVACGGFHTAAVTHCGKVSYSYDTARRQGFTMQFSAYSVSFCFVHPNWFFETGSTLMLYTMC